MAPLLGIRSSSMNNPGATLKWASTQTRRCIKTLPAESHCDDVNSRHIHDWVRKSFATFLQQLSWRSLLRSIPGDHAACGGIDAGNIHGPLVMGSTLLAAFADKPRIDAWCTSHCTSTEGPLGTFRETLHVDPMMELYAEKNEKKKGRFYRQCRGTELT